MSTLSAVARIAPRFVEPRVRLFIIYEMPLLRVPLKFAAMPLGEIGQLADGHRAGPDLDVRTHCLRERMQSIQSRWCPRDGGRCTPPRRAALDQIFRIARH